MEKNRQEPEADDMPVAMSEVSCSWAGLDSIQAESKKESVSFHWREMTHLWSVMHSYDVWRGVWGREAFVLI